MDEVTTRSAGVVVLRVEVVAVAVSGLVAVVWATRSVAGHAVRPRSQPLLRGRG